MQNRYEGNNHFKIVRLNFVAAAYGLLCVPTILQMQNKCTPRLQRIQRYDDHFQTPLDRKTFICRITFANKLT